VQDAGPVLRDQDLGPAVAVRDPVEQAPEAAGVGAQPGRLRDGADGVALRVFEEELEVADVVVWGRDGAGFGEVADVVGAVMVLEVEWWLVSGVGESGVQVLEGGRDAPCRRNRWIL